MTPRKELFIKVKKALMPISELELVDLQRNQMSSDRFAYLFVSALISVNAIQWQSMTEQNQEGTATVLIDLYCRDGWRNQHQHTEDGEEGLMEIDLIDRIAEAVQFLRGEQFRTLTLESDEVISNTMDGMFQYRLTFSCNLYRKLKPLYNNQKITL
ncbi:hypothetical protein [Riemerella columbipharyngis]|uniref:Uncharacterized protein n=1 Tax=Riemerella columbipharyngis TaxID=1071918 RepID=A0A1G7FLG9_9FLAO|nr:hypothetical protein [Riemerella columbipharyngis]SDE76771.1 hypothetical protein SAMN05421544_1249 [Riemerella columbipharyngis]